MTRRLYVHVGMPKTGTTYVQSVLHASFDHLRAQGLTLLPISRKGAYRLSMAVRDDPALNPEDSPESVLSHFSQRLSRVKNPRILFSDELLSAARSEQIARFLEACHDVEVHLVVSMRSMSRLLPSTWQQRIQQRGETPSLGEFLEAIATREIGMGAVWWRDRGPITVLERWSEHIPLERTHIVTMPGAGSDPRSLLERYADLLEIDAATLDADTARSNPSLGWAQAEVLRQVRGKIPPELVNKQGYLPVGKGWLAAEHLVPQRGEPPRMPSSLRAWCEEEAATTIAWLDAQPVEVIGDLSDLCPTDADFVDDPRLEADALATAAIDALASIALERTQETTAETTPETILETTPEPT